MEKRNFFRLLRTQWSRGNFISVGLDSEQEVPVEKVAKFNTRIIKTTSDSACAYKFDFGFCIGKGVKGIESLITSVKYVLNSPHEPLVILDLKCGSTRKANEGWARFAFDVVGADAVTVQPYMGHEDALEPFLERTDKGIFVLCATSNEGAGEFQDLTAGSEWSFPPDAKRARLYTLYECIAKQVSQCWNKNENCGVVVGATYPQKLVRVRKIIRDMPILMPGIGAQGGKVEDTVPVAKNSRGEGFIVSSSRGIIFAKDPRRETEKLRDLINQYR